MRRLASFFLLLLTGPVLLAAGSARASSRGYEIKWQCTSFKAAGSCLDVAFLGVEGQANFAVNSVPIPTRTIPGHFIRDQYQNEQNLYGAPFSSALLRWGPNQFFFDVQAQSPSQSCVIADDIVTLETGGLTARPLFMVARRGTAFHGAADVSLDLREINPGLSENIMRLEDAFERRKLQLTSIADNIEAAKAELALLDKLRADINELAKRPLDSISEQDLENLLQKYEGIDPSVRREFVQLLRDLKADIETLRSELNRIMADFRGQMGALDDWLVSAPPSGAPDLDAPGTYTPGLETETLPPVQLPDVNVGDDFDESKDPYLAYAMNVLNQLQGTEANDEVVNRGAFLSIVRSWRQNQNVMEKSLQSRGVVSQEEVGAFLNAQQMVLTHVRGFMDEQGWFHDSPVRPTTKSLIAYLRKRPDTNAQAEALQAQLNYWRGTEPSLQQKLILDTLDSLTGGWRAVDEGALAEDPTILTQLLRIGDSAEVLIKEVTLFGVGLTPVGDFIDLCEVVTGWETCNPQGNQLTTGDRMVTSLGIVGGSGKFWRFVAASTVSAVGMTVAKKAADLIERWIDLSKERRKELLTVLGEPVIERITNISGKQVEALLKRLGPETVKKLGAHLDGKALQELEKLSMLTIPDPSRRLHVLTHGQSVKGLGAMDGTRLADFENSLKSLGFKNAGLAENGDKVWTHVDCSVIRVAPARSSSPPYFRKEISMTPGQYNRDAIAAKVTSTVSEEGELVLSLPEWSESTIGASPQVTAWFANKLKKSVSEVRANHGAELEEMRKWWASQTHFNLLP
ncbi:hypothetical protein [Archangium primigenium]|uniref:hypothetical protein n=1 Tax=[Archangium] primigenium TaxID=2792470 RepID=UPI00195AD015|nr:hypothetical protein [Archangium primigenium]MBM7112134.1 hypothetical protein [Archangium primigenium]